MKKKLLLFTLLLTLVLTAAGCSSQSNEEEDPGSQKDVVSDLDNDVLESFLNQYNLDAENPISSDDLEMTNGNTATCKVTDLDLTFSTKEDGTLSISTKFSDLEDENLDIVVRDLIIAMDSELTYDNVKDMFSAMRDNGRKDYEMGDVKCKLKESKGTYTLTISNES